MSTKTATTTVSKSKLKSKPIPLEEYEQKIRIEAYLLWEKDGYPLSDGVKYWLQAEQNLKTK
jgi:hypothetical protein